LDAIAYNFFSCRYLDVAEADPLVAALHIINRRGMVKTFNKNSATVLAAVKVALRCAAVAAEHPDPQRFVEGWQNVSPGVGEVATKLSHPSVRFEDGRYTVRLIGTPTPDLELEELWKLASVRLAKHKPIGQELPSTRAPMKRMLLATIHRFYLKALGSLPQCELRERLHYSMLQGGNCYGPLDPVACCSPITLWPCILPVHPATRYPSLTPDQALQRLLDAGANLQVADHYFLSEQIKLLWSGSLQIVPGKPDAVHKHSMRKETAPLVSVSEAYLAAATAAFHCNPLAQKEFLGSPNIVANLQAAGRVLRLQDAPPPPPPTLL
jgi:hypothetical protein